jgi:diguanylate cyclase (GGDEF)-like protein
MQKIGEYTVTAVIYTGKNFSIYRSVRNQDQRFFILKASGFEHPAISNVNSLQHEYHILKQLDSPYVIKVCDIIQSQHQWALVLEDMHGISLHEYLKKDTLSLENFLKISIQLTDALSALHLKNVIHKDINPGNILIDPKTLAVKLIDFSLSTQLNHETSDPLGVQNLEGTLVYIAPEQTGRMNRPIDYRSDFYSLGITFYEMLVGEVPFVVTDPLELMHCHLAKTPMNVTQQKPYLPKVIGAIIAKLLAKTPEERYISAAGLRADLLRCQSEWLEKNSIDSFSLGADDVYDHLMISKKMYARELEVQELISAFERVSNGNRELVTLSGCPGIGKSSVVKETYRPLAYQKGYFIAGKYDHLSRNIPYSAIIKACQELIRRLLSEPNVELAKIKTRLLKALGNNVNIVIKAIPDLMLIMGESASTEVLPLVESQHKFSLAFQRFIRAIAEEEHPLTLFLDDVQWIDCASLDFLKALFLNIDSHYLLVIMAYQNDKITPEHPLMDFFNQLKVNAVVMTDLTLSPFKVIDIQHLLVDSLNCRVETAEPLANVLLEKTEGNPFFINELLKRLYQEKLLYFLDEQKAWRWDLNAIKKQSITENVVDLLMLKIKELPVESAKLLELSAAIGHLFELKTLSIISELPLAKVALLLWEPLQANLIAVMNDGYQLLEGIKTGANISQESKIEFKFSHERIQQAAYSLIPLDDRSVFHLKIGRLLLKDYNHKEECEQKEKTLFSVLNHLNHATQLITIEKERHELSRLNLRAGQNAKAATAYTAAFSYLQTGMKLLKNHDWNKEYTILFAFYKEMTECLFLLKKFDEAEEYIKPLIKNARSDLEKADIFFLKISAYIQVAKHLAAINLARKTLRLFRQRLPLSPSKITILRQVLSLKWRGKSKTILTAATCEETLVTNKILTTISSSAYQINQKLFGYIACKVLLNSLSKGYTPETPIACFGYAIILINKFNQIDEAFYFVELARKVQSEIKNKFKNSRYYLIEGAFINHWKYPLSTSLQLLEESYRSGVEEGNLAYASLSRMMSVVMFYLGKPLPAIKESIDQSVNFLKNTGNKDFYRFFQLFRYVILLLREDDKIIESKLETIFEKMKGSKSKTALVVACHILSQFFFIKGKMADALKMSENAYQLKDFVSGGFDFVFIEFFHALCLAGCYDKVNAKQQVTYREKLKKIQHKFKAWSMHNSDNFLYAYLLISAEIKRITLGFNLETIQLYNAAILSAEEHQYLPFIGMIYERAAKLCLDSKNPLFAKVYLQNAHYAYLQWGALAKCRLLEVEHPESITTHSTSMPANSMSVSAADVLSTSLDVLAIFKATKAIADEMQLNKLLQKLIDIVLKDAGANRALLLFKEENVWFIEAEGNLNNQKITLSQAEPLSSRSDIPVSLINFAQRTQELVLIQNAKELEFYSTHDHYLAQTKPQSILLLPIFYQGSLRHLLYLENKETSYAFTPTHIQTLKLLASQAAISLENARLYHQATHDPLTGLANRNLLYQVFELSAAKAKREKKNIAILFLDLDGFKKINDTYGHELGDKVLLYVSDQIKCCLRESDLAVRLGGDEFIVMLEDATVNVASLIAERILQAFAKEIFLMSHEMHVTTSIGISIYPSDGVDIQVLLKEADSALYQAKKAGKNNCRIFIP